MTLSELAGTLGFLGFVCSVAIGIVALCCAQASVNRNSIQSYLASGGCELLDMTWAPFGPGCLVSGKDPIYCIHYRDQAANIHEAYCVTSLLFGVYFTQDRIVQWALPLTPTQEPLLPEVKA